MLRFIYLMIKAYQNLIKSQQLVVQSGSEFEISNPLSVGISLGRRNGDVLRNNDEPPFFLVGPPGRLTVSFQGNHRGWPLQFTKLFHHRRTEK